MTDNDVQMMREIMRGLLGKYEGLTVTGWELWSDFVEARVPGGSYDRYKRLMRELEHNLRVVLTRPPNVKAKLPSMARSYVAVTEKGAEWWAEMEGGALLHGAAVEASSVQYVGKRIKGVAPIPRDAWQALMRRHKAGELDIAFLQAKK